jgi:nucleoside 2-deoxyribosyltransferase
MLKIYLAGESNEKEYRRIAIRKYSRDLNLFDPMSKIEANLPGNEPIKNEQGKRYSDSQIKYIVEEDKQALQSCDLVVAYIRKWSCGTIMEVITAWNCNIPVYVIDPTTKFRDDPWLRYHSNRFFNDEEACFNYILSCCC